MKIGVMNNPAEPVGRQIEFVGRAGFDFVDLTIEGPNALEIETKIISSILERYNLTIVGHTDPCLPYAYPIRSVREACLKELERCAGIFRKLGAKIMNIHPCYFCPPAAKPSLVSFNIEALQAIVEMAASYGLAVVFENYKAPFDRVSTFELLLDQVAGLGLHLDFGHANLGRDNHEVFCRHLGNAIRHVHFSDNRSTDDHHMPLGVGNIDWKNAVKSLKEIGYDGTITLEVFCEDSTMLLPYLEVSRKLLKDLWNEQPVLPIVDPS
jgi:sugar phosphate isomerase/epimerase